MQSFVLRITNGAPRCSLVLFLGLFLLTCSFTPVYAAPPAIGNIPGASKIAPGLLKKLEIDAGLVSQDSAAGQYRVVVGLQPVESEAELTAVFKDKTKFKTLRNNITKKQDKVLDSLARGKSKAFRLLSRYQNLYGFSAMVDLDAIEDLAVEPEVAYVEEMPVYYKTDAEAFALTDTNQAHQAGWTGSNVTIAIIDDGIEHDHPAFGGYNGFPNAKIIGGYDFADYDNDPTIDCLDQSHGTAVTGVAAGNGGGVTGTAPDARIVFLKIQSSSSFICGSSSLDGDVSGAIDWVISNRETYNIRVISMSFGSGLYANPCPNYSYSTAKAISAAQDAGIILVAASGNDVQTNRMTSPACHPDVISVGAVYDANLGRRRYSDCSDRSTYADLVCCYSNSASFLDVLAPATCAYTADTDSSTQSCFGGTSAATPYVAGVMATFFEKNASLDWNEAKAALVDNGDPVTDPRNGITKPRVNHLAALDAIVPVYSLTVTRTGSGAGTVSSSPAGINCGSSCTGEFNSGTEVTLTADPAAGAVFAGWTGGGCSGTGECVLTVDHDQSVSAMFMAQYTLNVSMAGTGAGSVSSSPAGIDCGADCSEIYVDGTSVTLSPAPDGGSVVTGWQGGGCSGTGDCVVSLDQEQTVIITFDILHGDINLDSSLDIADAILALQIAAGINVGSDLPVSADINGDGRIGFAEAIYALQGSAGLAPR